MGRREKRPLGGCLVWIVGRSTWGVVWCSELAALVWAVRVFKKKKKIRRTDLIISLFFTILIKILGGALQMLLAKIELINNLIEEAVTKRVVQIKRGTGEGNSNGAN